MNKFITVMQKALCKKLWRVLFVIFISFVVVFSVVLDVASSNMNVINNALGTTSFETVDTGGSADEDTDYIPSDYKTSEEVERYCKAVCEEVEAEGLVLMKNKNGALPLAVGDSVSCVLQNSVALNYGSSGSGKIDATKYADLKSALTAVGLSVNETLWSFYKTDPNATSDNYAQGLTQADRNGNQYYKVRTLPWSMYSSDAKTSISTVGGTALAVIGRLSGEGSDIDAAKSDGIDGSYLSLTENEMEILRQLTALKANGKIDKIVVMLNTASPVQTAFLDDSDPTVDVDACMWVGNIGVTGVNAIANVLVGNVTPSGKLTDTYVKDNFSSPAMASWKLNANSKFAAKYSNAAAMGLNEAQMYYGVYVEDIYVGYRYYETRYEDVVLGNAGAGTYDYSSVVSYPFGHGMSYASFDYSDYTVTEKENGDYEVSVKVTNTSADYDGKEVVQVYLQKPYTEFDRTNGIEKPAVELVGFGKTKLLKHDGTDEEKSDTVRITVEKSSFKTYDSKVSKTYILEEGTYYLAIGRSAHDALNNILAAKGKTVADGMDADGVADHAKTVGSNYVFDKTTFATSNGSAVTNRLGFADMNEYAGRGDNSVTYVSRNNWAGTWPTEAVSFAVTAQMQTDLGSKKAIKDDAGAKMPKYGANNGLTAVMLRSSEEKPVPYDDPMWDELLDQMTFAEQAYLVTNGVYRTSGVVSVSLPETIENDGPTGVVSSKTKVSFPSEGIWASSFNRELIQKVGDALAEDARNAGCHGMYLPGINLHRTPFGGRTHEYFSEDPYLSGVACEYEIYGVQGKGIVPFVKHFVFNDEEDKRNGVCIWLNEQSARELYLKPFEYAVSPEYGNAHGVMSSFNRAGCIWTSASGELCEDILRDEFGFDGFVLTDMASGNGATYMVYVDGFMNGTDMWLGSGTADALDAYKSNATFANKIRESCHRIIYTFANYCCVMNGLSGSARVVEITPWWKALLIAVVVVFAVFSFVSLAFMILSYVFGNKKAVVVQDGAEHAAGTGVNDDANAHSDE